MQHGSKMIKLDANRKGSGKKTFVLDPDMAGIRYQPSKKNSRCKLVASVFKIVRYTQGIIIVNKHTYALRTYFSVCMKENGSAMRTCVYSL